MNFRKPHRSDYESESDYTLALAREAEASTKAMARAIDAVTCAENPTTSRPKAHDYSWLKAGSVHDFLADNPRLLARYKEIGPLALLEL